jgi:hypothetical protein
MKKIILFLSIGLFIVFACKSKDNSANSVVENKMLNFTVNKIFAHKGNCENEAAPCALVDMKILQIQDSSIVCFDVLNNLLTKMAFECSGLLTDSLADKKINTTDIVNNYIKDYRDFRKDFPEVAQNWEANSTMKKLFENDSLLCVSAEGYNFSGGAHPNSFSTLLIFDKKNCVEIDPNNFLNVTKPLLAKIESAFRKARGIQVNESLNETGFYFQNDVFILPANIGIEKDSMLFWYNDYEVGPHVMGPTSFKMATQELKPFLKLKF